MAWAASPEPSHKVTHIYFRSPSRNSYLGGKAWSTYLWRELRLQVLCLCFLYLTTQPNQLSECLFFACPFCPSVFIGHVLPGLSTPAVTPLGTLWCSSTHCSVGFPSISPTCGGY